MQRCKNCSMIWIARPGYYCYVGSLVIQMEKETSVRKRLKLRRQIDWALGNLQEMEALQEKRHAKETRAKAKRVYRQRRRG